MDVELLQRPGGCQGEAYRTHSGSHSWVSRGDSQALFQFGFSYLEHSLAFYPECFVKQVYCISEWTLCLKNVLIE